MNLDHVVATRLVGASVEVLLTVDGATVTLTAEEAESLFVAMGLA